MTCKELTPLEITALDLEREAAGAVGQNVQVCDGCGNVDSFPNWHVFKNCVLRVGFCEECGETEI